MVSPWCLFSIVTLSSLNDDPGEIPTMEKPVSDFNTTEFRFSDQEKVGRTKGTVNLPEHRVRLMLHRSVQRLKRCSEGSRRSGTRCPLDPAYARWSKMIRAKAPRLKQIRGIRDISWEELS